MGTNGVTGVGLGLGLGVGLGVGVRDTAGSWWATAPFGGPALQAPSNTASVVARVILKILVGM